MPQDTELPTTRTWGLDMSTTPKKTAAVAIEWTSGHATVVDVRQRLAAHDVVDLIDQERDCMWAVDVPFGWPDLFVKVMRERHEHPLPKSQLPESAKWGMWRTQLVAQRQTDMYVTQDPRIKTRPLPASFQMLGATAAMWVLIEAELLEKGVTIDRSGMSGHICETYPAAALAAWGAPKSGKLTRDSIVSLFPFLAMDDSIGVLLDNDDACDGLICSLVARARQLELTIPPTEELAPAARREGWIHVSVEPRDSLIDSH